MIRVAVEIQNPKDGGSRLVEFAHSWVKQMAQHWLTLARNAPVTGVLDTAGVSRVISGPTDMFLNVIAGTGDNNFGILVGTGAAAPTRDDINLGAKIAHGNGAGQLFHQALILGSPLAIAGGRRVTISRQFDNNSGGPITVQEIALVVADTGPLFFLVLRDLVTELIPNGASRVFKYHLDWLA